MNQESRMPSSSHGSSSAPALSLASKADTWWWPSHRPRWHACSWRWIARCPAALHPNRLPSVFPNFGPGNRLVVWEYLSRLPFGSYASLISWAFYTKLDSI
ncbi:hypothetical protein VPH35_085945 [Triticum aestivum]